MIYYNKTQLLPILTASCDIVLELFNKLRKSSLLPLIKSSFEVTLIISFLKSSLETGFDFNFWYVKISFQNILLVYPPLSTDDI